MDDRFYISNELTVLLSFTKVLSLVGWMIYSLVGEIHCNSVTKPLFPISMDYFYGENGELGDIPEGKL